MRATGGTDTDDPTRLVGAGPAGRRLPRSVRGVLLLGFGLVLVLFGLVACEPATTCSATWVGPAAGDFATGGNWSGGAVPGAAAHVCSPVGSSIVVSDAQHIGSGAFQGSLTVLDGASLTIDGGTSVHATGVQDLTLEGTLDGGGSLSVLGSADVSGVIRGSGMVTMFGSGTRVWTNPTVEGSKVVEVAAASILGGAGRICDDAQIRLVYGMVSVADGTSITTGSCGTVGSPSIQTGLVGGLHVEGSANLAGPQLVNAGALVVDGGVLTVSGITQSSGSTRVGGVGQITSSGAPGSATFALEGGELTGDGSVALQVSGSGRIAPGIDGATPGETLTVSGWNAGTGAVLAAEIDTAGGHGHDRLVVTGTANITAASATIDVWDGGGVVPGTVNPILQASSVVGTFTAITLDPEPGVNWSGAYGGYTATAWSVAADDCAPGAFGAGVDRTGDDLEGQFLRQCGMAYSVLREVNLRNADLAGADLAGVDLTGADLTGADITGTSWSNTTCPDGVNSDAAGNSCAGHLVIPKTFVVTTTADAADANVGNGICATAGGQCSLRAAVQEANAWPAAVADTIELATSATYPLSLNGGEDAAAAGDLDITGPLTIHGNQSTISNGGLIDRLVELRGGPFTATDLTISGANASNDGAALYVQADVVATLTRVNLSGNTTTQAGGAIRTGDSAALPGIVLTLVDSVIADNNAGNGGGIFNGWNNTVVIRGTAIRGNDATNGWGGGVFTEESVTIERSAVTGNTATGSGGGVYVATGGLSMVDTTVSGNSGADGSGVRLWDNVTGVLTNVTITQNTGPTGAFFANPGAQVQFANSIVAGQQAGPDCNAAYVSNATIGQNVESSTTCRFTGATNRQNTDPKLKPLAANGGLTLTHLPFADSPIIGLVPTGVTGCLGGGVDQRGIGRPQGGACEPGAIEWVPGETSAVDCTAATTGPGSQRQYCDFTNVSFYGRHMQGANFTGTNFTNAELTEARLSGAIFTDAKVTSARFNWTYNFNEIVGFATTKARSWADLEISGQTLPNFTGIDLRNVEMNGMTVEYGNFTNATFGGNVGTASFVYSNLSGADFTDAVVTGTSFFNTDLTNADLTDATLAGASFSGSSTSVSAAIGVRGTLAKGWQNTCFCGYPILDFTNLDLSGQDLTGTVFTGADLSGGTFTGATLTNAELGLAAGADLAGVDGGGTGFYGDVSGATFAGADLSGSWFRYATVAGADFTDATITGARFTGVGGLSAAVGFRSTAANGWAGLDLTQTTVDLTNTDLAGVDMTNAKFGNPALSQSVDLSGSDLTGADMTGAQITRLVMANVTGINTVIGLFGATNWENVDVTGSGLDATGQNLTGRTFAFAKLGGTNFTNANLTSTQWYGATVTGADFTGTGVGSSVTGFFSTAANSWAGTDFSGGALDAAGANLVGTNMAGADLSGCLLVNADLTGANLTGAKITGARMMNVYGLSGVTGLLSTAANSWAGTDFTQNYLDLSGADLSGRNLSGAKFGNESLSHVVNFTGANLAGTDLTGAAMTKANLTNVSGLTGAQMLSTATNWYGVNLTGTNLDLSGADLRGRTLAFTTLSSVNLAGANLSNVPAYVANWAGANLTNATITGAQFGSSTGLASATGFTSTAANSWAATTFSSGDLAGVNFTGIDLRSAYWAGANLTNANFTNANLGATPTFRTANFTGAVWSNTTCPDNTNSNANGGTCTGHIALTRMAVGTGGAMQLSADGVNWVTWSSGTTADLNAATNGVTQNGEFGSPLFIAVGANGTVISSTVDYAMFTPRSYGSMTFNAVACNGQQCAVVGSGGTIYSSYFVTSLSARTSGTSNDLHGVTWTGSRWVAVGVGGTVVTSTDATTWTVQSSGTAATLRAVTWTGSMVVAVGDAGVVRTSPDGITWTGQTSGTTQTMRGVTWTGSQVVAAGDTGRIITSPDGVTWSLRTSGTTDALRAVAVSGSQILVVGVGGRVVRSSDGISWTLSTAGTADLRGIARL